MKPNAALILAVVAPVTIVAAFTARRPAKVQPQNGKPLPLPSAKNIPDAAPRTKITRREVVPNGVRDEASGLVVPRGFSVTRFADNLDGPRRIAIAPGATAKRYDVFVTESRANRVRALRDANGDGRAEANAIFNDKLNQPYGLAFSPDGFLYVGNTDAVVRLPYKRQQTQSNDKPEQIARLTEGGYNQHWTRNLLFAEGGRKLYVTVGSSCNTCEEDDPQRAAISVMRPDGSGKRLYATGLRNPVGITQHNGALWTVVNERDRLGDNIPPDYLTQVRPGAFYGWPYAYTTLDRKVVPDPNFGRRNREKVRKTVAPTVPVQAHSAALGVAFYPSKLGSGAKAFPPQYRGDAFLTFHGSWNRSERTGYKVVRVDFQNGKPVSVTDFARGFLRRNGEAWGRPTDVQVAPDGALLFSDDENGVIWRVAYTG